PMTFGGVTEDLNTFVCHFKVAASYNKWTEDDKVAYLRLSLIDEAAIFMQNATSDDATYQELVTALKMRYSNDGQTALFRAQLGNRKRRIDETLSDLYYDVSRLTALAYPGPLNEITESIGVDAFIDSLDDDDFE